MISTLPILLALSSAVDAFAASLPSTSLPSPQLLYRFPPATFLENIAVQSNGRLLLTSLTTTKLLQLDPRKADPLLPEAVTVPEGNGCSGITEFSRDKYAVICAVWNLAAFSATNFSAWAVDLTRATPKVSKIAALDGHTINGLASIPGIHDLVLMADSFQGAVKVLNVTSGQVDVVLKDTLLQPTSTGAVPIGVNGVKYRHHTVHFTNSAAGLYSKFDLSKDGKHGSNITVLANMPTGQTGYDDFSLDARGNAWISSHPNSVDLVTPSGRQSTVVGGVNSTGVESPTSNAFGRGHSQDGILYITAAGDAATLAGEVWALHTASYFS